MYDILSMRKKNINNLLLKKESKFEYTDNYSIYADEELYKNKDYRINNGTIEFLTNEYINKTISINPKIKLKGGN